MKRYNPRIISKPDIRLPAIEDHDVMFDLLYAKK